MKINLAGHPMRLLSASSGYPPEATERMDLPDALELTLQNKNKAMAKFIARQESEAVLREHMVQAVQRTGYHCDSQCGRDDRSRLA